jgi:alpha-amylase/alpha-mannosidase (GH57 family)
VDSNHVEAVTPMSWQELRYRPHIARYGEDEIVVVVRDRELSDAQLSGMDLNWFTNELSERTKGCDFPPLVTTATDGDNGGWFRNPQMQSNFWGLYRNLLDQARSGEGTIRPTFIEDYLDRYGVHGEVKVGTGAWNTGWHHGHGFLQWTGSQAQKDALARVKETSHAVHDARWRAGETRSQDGELHYWLEQAMWRLLRAETSCNIFWGEAWVPRVHHDLDASWEYINQARHRMEE